MPEWSIISKSLGSFITVGSAFIIYTISNGIYKLENEMAEKKEQISINRISYESEKKLLAEEKIKGGQIGRDLFDQHYLENLYIDEASRTFKPDEVLREKRFTQLRQDAKLVEFGNFGDSYSRNLAELTKKAGIFNIEIKPVNRYYEWRALRIWLAGVMILFSLLTFVTGIKIWVMEIKVKLIS